MPSHPIMRLQHRNHVRRQPLQINLPTCATRPLTNLGINPRLRILHLPNPPQPIQRGMMEVEDWITRRHHRVTTRVAPRDVMPRGVNPPVVGVGLVRRGGEKGVVEGVDVFGLGDQVKSAVGGRAEGGVDVDVAAHAARVVAATGGEGVFGDVVHDGGARTDGGAVALGGLAGYLSCLEGWGSGLGGRGGGGLGGREEGDELYKGTCGDAATTAAGLHQAAAGAEARVVGIRRAVAAHAGRIAVK